MSRRRIVSALALCFALPALISHSAASFVARSSNPANSFATAADWTIPAVTLVVPATGAALKTTTPTLLGVAGTAAGDSSTITVRIYSGAAASGTPVQTRMATAAGGLWATTATALAQGTYTAQASQSDSASHTGVSAAHTFTIDTTVPTATDIAAFDAGTAGTTAGHLDVGDRIVFSYSEAIAPASVLAGFTGASTAIEVRFFHSSGTSKDTFSVLDTDNAHTVKLESGSTTAGGVKTFGDYVSTTATFAATMKQSADAKHVTLTLGGPAPAGVQTTAVTAKAMTWGVPAGVTDRATNAVVTNSAVPEAGAADRDF